MEHVRADHTLRREPEQQDQPDGDQRAAARRGHAEHEADGHAQHHRGDLVPPLHLDGVALALVHALQERPDQRGGPGEEERAGEQRDHGVLEVVPEPVLEQRQDVDAATAAGTDPIAIQLDSVMSTVFWLRCL